MRRSSVTFVSIVAVFVAGAVFAEFPGTDVVVPVAARIQGSGNPPPQFYSTVWLTNLSTSTSTALQLLFYQRDSSANPTASANLTLAPGETRKLDDAVTTLFGLTAVAGSLRVIASSDVLVSSRNYDLPAGGTEKDTTGQYFGAIPVDFAIGSGEVTQLQGIEQTTEARYNFGAVEIAGQSVNFHAAILDSTGATIGGKDYSLPPHGQMQKNITDITSAINGVANALLQISVTGGSGKILAYGTHNTNGSQDGTGFEMAFKQALLSGSGGGLSAVNHDGTLSGDGTSGAPLGIAAGGVSDVNVASGIAYSKLSGAPTSLPPNGPAGGSLSGTYPNPGIAGGAIGMTQLADGAVSKSKISATGGTAGQVLGTDGANLAWQTAGTAGITGVTAGTGLTGGGTSGNVALGVQVPLTLSGTASSGTILGYNTSGIGVHGESGSNDGVYGYSASAYGVSGVSATGTGVFGQNTSIGNSGCVGCTTAGVVGNSATNNHSAVVGNNSGGAGGVGVYGLGDYAIDGLGTTYGVYGKGATGVYGTGNPGVQGVSTGNDGVNGTSTSGYGVHGQSSSNEAIYGQNTNTLNDGCVGCPTAGVIGYSPTNQYSGVYGNNAGGGTGVAGNGATGVIGNGSGNGVVGEGGGNGVVGHGGQYGVYCEGNGAYIGSWSNVSDARLKRDVVTLADALDKVMELRGVSFTWRREEFPDKPFDAGPQIGFIAQEVEPVYPEVVSTGADGFKTLDYSKLTPILTEAIKAQQAIMEAQRGELDDVKARVAHLETLLASLDERLRAGAPSSPR